jgi:KUP system potassium uptake protein
VYLRQIVQDLQAAGKLPPQEKKYSIYGPSTVGTFKFCVIHKSVPTMTELSTLDELILHSKYAIRKAAGSKVRWYGLDTSSLIIEHVPLITGGYSEEKRIQPLQADKK